MKKGKWSLKTIVVSLIVGVSVIGASAAIYNIVVPEKVVEDNGYYRGTGKFDNEKTPVANMMLLLKVLNGSNYCDNDWYAEVQEVQAILQKQIEANRNNRDPYVIKMMDLQSNIVKNLRAFTTSAWLPMLSEYDVNQLQKSYNAYHDYYYQQYGDKEGI